MAVRYGDEPHVAHRSGDVGMNRLRLDRYILAIMGMVAPAAILPASGAGKDVLASGARLRRRVSPDHRPRSRGAGDRVGLHHGGPSHALHHQSQIMIAFCGVKRRMASGAPLANIILSARTVGSSFSRPCCSTRCRCWSARLAQRYTLRSSDTGPIGTVSSRARACIRHDGNGRSQPALSP